MVKNFYPVGGARGLEARFRLSRFGIEAAGRYKELHFFAEYSIERAGKWSAVIYWAIKIGRGMAEDKPPRIQPRLVAAPKIRRLYYCEFWKDTQLPEFWKTRPVVVVSFKNTLHGPCTVIPTSTAPQQGNNWAHKFSVQFDGVQSWAVCNHPVTIAPSRLSQFRGRTPIVPQADFDAILRLLLARLPKPTEQEGN